MQPKICQCSFETAQAIKKARFGMYKHLGRRLRAEYIAEQEIMQKALYAVGYEDDMPPCVNCPPEVFTFCSTTGNECKIFTLYTVTGKTGEHTCFHKLADAKKRNPTMEKYCTEDCQKITVPKPRIYPKERKQCKKNTPSMTYQHPK